MAITLHFLPAMVEGNQAIFAKLSGRGGRLRLVGMTMFCLAEDGFDLSTKHSSGAEARLIVGFCGTIQVVP